MAVALAVNLILNLIFLIVLGKGLIFSAMILSVSRIVMALGAMWVIYQSYPFSLDWKFLGKNVIVISVLMLILWRMKSFFVLEGRWELLGALVAFFAGYGIVLAGMNWTQIKFLLKEIKTLSAPVEDLPVESIEDLS